MPDASRIASTEDGNDIHALAILRRRLNGLYDARAVLNISSRAGEGATVILRLPLDYGGAVVEAAEPPWSSARESAATEAPSLR